MSGSDILLRAEGLAIGYRSGRRLERRVRSGLDLALERGELVCLLGPNGVGKSTLLRTLAGLLPPLEGSVRVEDREVTSLGRERARLIAVVLTEPIQAGLLTAYELVGLGRYPHTDWLGRLTRADDAAIRRALALTGASGLAPRPVGELSDGERQKVMIARALAQEPKLLILDEPTAFLDLPRRVVIMAILRRLARGLGRAVLLATHNLELALRSADRIWLLPSGGALESGAPEDLVLSGALAAAFQSESSRFDVEDGTFRVEWESGRRVFLEGKGLAARWTARALAREGLEVSDDESADIRIVVEEWRGKASWESVVGCERRTHGSLYELCRCLRQHLDET